MRRWLLAAVVLFAAAVAVLQDAPPVAAHALLARADPPINAALRESPSAVSVFMTEPLQRDYSSVRVLDSSGERRDIGDTEFCRGERDADACQRVAAGAGRLHGGLADALAGRRAHLERLLRLLGAQP